MEKTIYENLTEQEWLALKAEDISSTEVSALYNKSPYDTAFSLYHEKTGQLPADEVKAKRAFWGKVYEAPTAEAVAKMYGVKIRKMGEYMRHHTTPRMGASFDYQIIGIDEDWTPTSPKEVEKYSILRDKFLKDGPGILEIKLVDFHVHRREWSEEEAPIHIEFQIQQQMEIATKPWTALVASVIGYDIHIILRDRDENLGKKLCRKITKFWDSVEALTPPAANYSEDFEIIKNLYNRNGDSGALDFGSDPRFHILCRKAARSNELQKKLEAIEEAAKAELLAMIKDSPMAISSNFVVKFTEVKSSPKTTITQDMVGTQIGGRAGYRTMKIKQIA